MKTAYQKFVLFSMMITIFISCSNNNKQDKIHFDKALKNGYLVNEGFTRSLNYVTDWLTYTDSLSGLIPENLSGGKNVWNAHNSAADNYPFMVLTSYLLDKELFNGQMLDILNTERKLTSRLGSLPDSYSFTKQDFLKTEIDTSQIIFGTSEYIKDGLIPLTEYIGSSPWSDRMLEMLDDLSQHMDVIKNMEGKFYGNSVETEINGEMLQTLSRIYWMTKDEKYLNWAIKIADYYLLENPEKILHSEQFRLRDHGCEIIGGLSEIYATLHFVNKDKKGLYQKKIHEIFERILDIGRNEDGMFYNEINMTTGAVVDANIVDNWGYIYNAYYTIYLLDNNIDFLHAVQKPLKLLNEKYRNFNWENKGSDGFADAIESGINLYNRERIPELEKWINSEIKLMWSIQDSSFRDNAKKWKNTGIIEGWHGDGNFARTTIMYCLWKTIDVTAVPWNEDLIFGSEEKEGVLHISLKSKRDWEGTLFLGTERHKDIFNLPVDYPRINQFPEWFTIKNDEYYSLEINYKSSNIEGKRLKEGIKLIAKKDIPYLIKVTKLN